MWVASSIVAAASGEWAGRRVLVTAGPTYEDLDPVRYLGNRSSGRMGYAIAAAAAARGAAVTLVSGPTTLPAPHDVELVRVRSAGEMHAEVMERSKGSDLVVMAAAVADYTPDRPSDEKIPKQPGPLTVTLKRTPDILADLGSRRALAGADRPVLVGFAAETSAVIERARVAGCSALVVTIDTPVAGWRERDHRNGIKELMSGSLWEKLPFLPQVLAHPTWLAGFLRDGGLSKLPNVIIPGQGPMDLVDVTAALARAAVTWHDLEWIRRLWPGPLVIKGVLTGDDARRAADRFAQGLPPSRSCRGSYREANARPGARAAAWSG